MLVHRKELIEQNAEKLLQHGHKAELYCASLKSKGLGQITFASVQSLARVKDLPGFDFVIVDECHRIPTKSFGQYRKVLDKVGAPCVGFTATPYRLQGGVIYGKDRLFPRLNYRISVSALLKQGYLSPVVGYRGAGEADLTGVGRGRDGDFAKSQLQDAYTDETLVPIAVANLLKACEAPRRDSIIIFAAGIQHALMISEELAKHGEQPRIVTGETKEGMRSESIEMFRSGQIRVLINVGVFTEGFDAPNVDCVALMRATLSPGLYMQMVGRGMRLFDGKEDCLLMDYGGNVLRHGPIDNIQPPANAREKAPATTKVCPMCEMLAPIRKKHCPGCGYEFPPSEFEAQAKHSALAGALDPLDPKNLKRWRVGHITYKLHKKAGKPDSVKVSYHKDAKGALGVFTCRHNGGSEVNEFLCPEHGGRASARARQWMIRHGISPSRATCASELLELLSGGYALEPTEVVINKVGKWPELVDIVF